MPELILYNSLSRLCETFKPISEGHVGLYSCGPTVYNYPHIGNYRAYLFNDLLARTLSWCGYDVTHIMNITDVDDKTIRNSKKEETALAEFTSRYTQAFLEDLASLNIESISRHPRATDHIPEMIELIQKLIDRGFAYCGDDGSIYFSISSFNAYGSLAHLDQQSLKAGASGRVNSDEYTKDHVHDFALWKAWSTDDGNVGWDSPWGRGRPGWHIECSVMSMKYLGTHFDIHAGGIDLLFPHHENEIAQSECASGETFVNYWVHNAWLLVDGKKMAKRDGNFYTLRDLIESNYHPLAYRMFCLSSHYRQPLNFTFDALDAASTGYQNLIRDCAAIKHSCLKNSAKGHRDERVLTSFTNALCDDLNSPQALAVIFEYIKELHREGVHNNEHASADAYETLRAVDQVLGLRLINDEQEEIPTHIRELAEKRFAARQQRDWSGADALRMRIEQEGWTIEDHTDRYQLWRS